MFLKQHSVASAAHPWCLQSTIACFTYVVLMDGTYVQDAIPPELLPANPDMAATPTTETTAEEASQQQADLAAGESAAASRRAGSVEVGRTAKTAQTAPLKAAGPEAVTSAHAPSSPAPGMADSSTSTASRSAQPTAQPAAEQHAAAPLRLKPAPPAVRPPTAAGGSSSTSTAQPVAQQAAAPGAPVAQPQQAAPQQAAVSQPQQVSPQRATHPAARPGEPKPVFPVPLTVEEEVEQVRLALIKPAILHFTAYKKFPLRSPIRGVAQIHSFKPLKYVWAHHCCTNPFDEPQACTFSHGSGAGDHEREASPQKFCCSEQVADAVLRAWRAGVRRQMVQLMLPLRQARHPPLDVL